MADSWGLREADGWIIAILPAFLHSSGNDPGAVGFRNGPRRVRRPDGAKRSPGLPARSGGGWSDIRLPGETARRMTHAEPWISGPGSGPPSGLRNRKKARFRA